MARWKAGNPLPPDLFILPPMEGWRRPSTFSLRGVCIGPPPVGVEVTEPGYAEGTGHAHCNFDEPWEQGTASPATMVRLEKAPPRRTKRIWQQMATRGNSKRDFSLEYSVF
ncbi:uncharacterized protein TNIN_439531 [Trichonephila inaurata madagascariensis]|uniref:Uncharacterized protein n=1 Tax=Trichonephila inaurata madagascariensis TaxID=2747483 RepID=A0A8X6YEK1_9ARAC|nr:uncharacterized protein TNIN_439531 [Trichonephila inaurata madagascariensis]